MELQKRDRGWVRTAKDIEMKYDLGRITKLGKKLETSNETLERLMEENEDLHIKYGDLENKLLESEEAIKNLTSMLEEVKGILNSIERKVICYTTVEEFEDCFALPSDYRSDCLLDVFVNGLRVGKDGYEVILEDTVYFVHLFQGLDVVGTMLEIDMIEKIGEGECL